MTPMWMSWMAVNSGAPVVHVLTGLPDCGSVWNVALPTTLPAASRQFGVTRRPTRSGTASFSTFCLSAIDDELSIMMRRSILSTAV